MIRIFLTDDHPIVREGIISLLSREPEIRVVGQAEDGESTLEQIPGLHPDVVVMDISMPGLNGIETAEMLFHSGYEGKVIVLTQHEKEEYVRLALQVGVTGYLVKYSISEEILTAIRTVHAGEMYFSPAIAKMFAGEYVLKAQRKRAEKHVEGLTNREVEVLRYIAEGNSSKQIAEKMFVGLRTVEFHRANIIQKLGIRDVAGLTRFAIKHGLIQA